MTGTVPTTARDAIRDLVDAHAAALSAGDAEAVAALYAPDARSFDLRPPLQYRSSREQRADDLRAWYGGFAGPALFEVRELTVEAFGDVAFAHGLARLTATPHGSPGPFSLWYRMTLGLRRVDGSWLITHEHKSTPFYMEMAADHSFKAAVDLEP
ncbi:MAG TPA: SgcJ/EcaC family oxidoreductase [Jatrophihabitans sp.]|uniref:YybH family protein n=1 Tax=Jatrophihabitans sp. TaxID=1932789 RepID=UPI002E003444|nr:SgcJ/EcaC family oxidoreductase [Jatrophihabitans sp.]